MITIGDFKKARMERAVAAIVSERRYQDFINNKTLSIGDELVLMREYMRRAELEFTENFDDPHETETLSVIRKITAIGMRCLENHGAPMRVTGRDEYGE